MTVRGNDLVHNCRSCYAQHGFGVALKPNGDGFDCPHCNSKYVTEGGYMKRVS